MEQQKKNLQAALKRVINQYGAANESAEN